jgi:hypothetical protein
VLGENGGQTPAVVLYAANLTGVVLIGMWIALFFDPAGRFAAAKQPG